MADGDPYNSARLCPHPGCGAPFAPTNRSLRYCEAHRGQKWNFWRFEHRRSVERTVPKLRRTEREIRADLAAQLTAQVRRFNSMVAHDRATDPLR